MTETFGSYFGQAHGSVHSGDGNQYNFYYVQEAASRLREQANSRARTIAQEDREHLAACFVPPPGMQRARGRLAESHTVLIAGLPGSGRRATALMLLHELSEARGSLHELPDTSDDTTSNPLDIRDINEGDRLLLDLSDVDESRYVAVQNALSDFHSGLTAHGAHLAVVLPHRLGYLLRDELKRLTVDIGRPSARRLLALHLRYDGITFSPEELGGTELGAYVTQAPLRDVAGLADRIRHCRDASPADRGFSDWLSESLLDQHDQTARVATDLSGEQNGRQRALLLSVAMFHDTTPGTVLDAANSLLAVLSHPPDPTPRLDRIDLRAELTAVKAETWTDGRVRFRVPGYDQAVRNHFWTFLPDIRRQFRDWFKGCLADPSLPQSDRTRAVERFAFQSLRTARPQDLIWLAEEWTSRKAPAHLIPDAAQALALGLDDDQHGRFFRQQIYDWSTSMETGDRLRQVLVVVCAETMARTHPDQALVRLHHLARRSAGVVGAEVRAALLKLLGSDRRLYRRMLDRLSASISQGNWAKDLDLFLELADPVRMVGYRAVRESLVSCWAGVLARPVMSWAVSLTRWLTAAEEISHRDLVLRVLSEACAADIGRSGQVYRVALGWSRAGGGVERADTVAHLLRRIDTAQGLEPYDYAV
ncbi:ABC transporter substrate-binding protein [Streptomyces pseudovenezuelae]|uniref:ABC transporter substrate-binding protein n=1 Tax=Streptomyces pseudovenezuelae TaxID=67350 RepID=A0ABT6LLH1_9ACTN|nr:ABC transporter substrate-binding protein [Streptomyces pseudovenezuelae]MDH6217161.1 hypothetical protein [Streptomyces pseudovenezuelae]